MASPAPAQHNGTLPDALSAAEERRIAAVQKIVPATIAVFDSSGQGGGSGVIVTPDGLAVTNFHVVAPCGVWMKCGLPDGRFVDAVLVGLDPPGDVAVIKLLESDSPGGEDGDSVWPVAEWGDSDQVSMGDEAIVAGNPFLLATDFQPTVTHGVISGVHRYQYPAGTLLEYADCLQTDAAINPGNSGGPLYDIQGRLIGINGRGSFEKRGRVNVGVGYAISSNQVRRYLSHLCCGRIVDHASLGATVKTVAGSRVVIDRILEDSDAYHRGLRYGDEIVRFAGREITSANALQNALGTYPPGWKAPITYRRGYDLRHASVRLDRLHGAAQLEALVAQQIKPPEESDSSADSSDEDASARPGFYERRAGFANYYFNRLARDRTLDACGQRLSTELAGGDWTLVGQAVGVGPMSVRLTADRAECESDQGRYWAQVDGDLADQLAPPGSGGLLAAMHLWRRVLVGDPPDTLTAVGHLAWRGGDRLSEVLSMAEGGAIADVYFDLETGDLRGIEMTPYQGADPCRLEFAEFGVGPGNAAPARIRVLRGDDLWLDLMVEEYVIEPAEPQE